MARADLPQPMRLRRFAPGRLAASVACLIAADIGAHPDARERRLSSEALRVLDVLQSTGRLPDEGTLTPACDIDVGTTETRKPSVPDVLARMLAATVWLRGPGHVLVSASCMLSRSPFPMRPWQIESPLPGVLWALWLRELYRSAEAAPAWSKAVEALGCSGFEVSAELRSRADIRLDVPEAALLRQIRHCMGDATSCATALERAKAMEAPSILVLTAAVLGLIHGEQAVLEALDVPITVIAPWQALVSAVETRAVRLPRLNRQPPITSDSHPLPVEAVLVRRGNGGVFGVSPCPGENGVYRDGTCVERDLRADLVRIRDWGATDIVCLLPNDLIHDQGLGGMEWEAEALGLGFFHFPAPMHGVEAGWNEADWGAVTHKVADLVQAGRRPAIHGEEYQELPALLAQHLLLALHGALDAASARKRVDAVVEQIAAQLAAYPHY